jgi:hypothetical protein
MGVFLQLCARVQFLDFFSADKATALLFAALQVKQLL